ncbi:heat-inducible transcriptional repressor HrcA [Corynebacterium imitans]|uniref:heat-inducible transcriptional repressor HrcA n=1 Tax=Corynebacterium imitans TaxID=156978 RepID=UPI00255037D6|nr:heat-inducible transcriptional repressor HrcA [Corynebacterium imitans]MDK8306158.1 heat-inducible transcriptional repressor HrcA [Corynebacterium imitans]MDK8637174.1 heat-inducible transcriptional repressor HrcA [Corynebacterium imitans]MDK8772153.1 heat-inducible transcriptional repressor HrcA [Corynebacterium imitans]
MSAADDRRRAVLRAIVADYIAQQEPVGSKALVERHKLGVSSATIRNDMSVLEQQGYISQTHTSSGRIPTQAGYRAFVDALHDDVKPLSVAERHAILDFLEHGVDLEDVLRRSVQLLAQLTNQAAVVQLPNLEISRVKHCEVVALTPTRLLLVVITDSGRVDQRNVELASPLADAHVPVLRDLLNDILVGRTMREATAGLSTLHARAPRELADAVSRCTAVLVDTLVDTTADRLLIAGAGNLTVHRLADLHSVIDALEQQVVVLKLLATAQDLERVSVRIGRENENEEFSQAAIVTTAYGSGDEALGGLGVVGPTYMDYPGTMQKVATVARYISRILQGK